MPTNDEILHYVVTLARENPPVDGRIQINLSDHVASIDNGTLTIGKFGDVNLPPQVTSAIGAAIRAMKEGEEHPLLRFVRRVQAIQNVRNCRALVVLELAGANVSGKVLEWNGRSDAGAALRSS